jgi:hypothetical protein
MSTCPRQAKSQTASLREFCSLIEPRPVKNETWFIEDFYTFYNEKKLRKPRIQRHKCWKEEQTMEYIKFITSHQNTCLPLSVNDTEYDGSNVYMLFDGNNRTNAILDFYHKPLSIFHIIPKEFNHIKPLLEQTKLPVLLKRKYTYQKFCKDHECTPNTSCEQITIEERWDEMIECLEKLHFEKVRIQVTVYDHLSSQEMQDIYESINRGGMVLTEQDLLASSLANQQYADIPSNIISSINEYYDDMNQDERLQMTEYVIRLNLFEVLMGLQILLSKTYKFIPAPNATKDLDIVFYIWKLQHGFTTVAPSMAQVTQFILSIQDKCAELQDILNRMYDTSLGFNKFQPMRKTPVITSILYLLYDSSSIQVKKQYIHKSILYHTMLVSLYNNDTIRPEDRARDIFWRVSGGKVLSSGLYKELMTHTFESREITCEHLREALRAVMEKNIRYEKDERKKNKWLEALLLSAFYNQQVPSNTKLLAHEIDHIVPYSVGKQFQVDSICRVGNKQIIPAKINASRKTKPITDKWVIDNKLTYQQYPTGQEYAEIYDGKTLHLEKFNAMCTRREEMYIEHILTSYHY